MLAGKESVAVVALSELAKKCQATVPQVILAAQQQGYTVLDWEEYQKLLDEIGKLIGGNEEQGKTIEPPGHVAVGIPVSTTDSAQEVKILPKSSPS